MSLPSPVAEIAQKKFFHANLLKDQHLTENCTPGTLFLASASLSAGSASGRARPLARHRVTHCFHNTY